MSDFAIVSEPCIVPGELRSVERRNSNESKHLASRLRLLALDSRYVARSLKLDGAK